MINVFGIPPTKEELFPPYPKWADKEMVCVEMALAEAWNSILNSPQLRKLLKTANEEWISERLEYALACLHQNGTIVPGFSGHYFQLPIREASVPNHDGTKIGLSPDFTFRRAAEKLVFKDPRQFAYFVECKIVDKTHKMSKYADEGIMRFCDGRYASSMPFAAMLAYVRHEKDQTPSAQISLQNEFNRVDTSNIKQAAKLMLQGKIAICTLNNTSKILVSTHKRELPVGVGQGVDLIELRHIWLFVSS